MLARIESIHRTVARTLDRPGIRFVEDRIASLMHSIFYELFPGRLLPANRSRNITIERDFNLTVKRLAIATLLAAAPFAFAFPFAFTFGTPTFRLPFSLLKQMVGDIPNTTMCATWSVALAGYYLKPKIHIKGDSEVTWVLPRRLYVEGNLSVWFLRSFILSEELQVDGDLDLKYSSITSLPENLQVGGDLNLEYSSITSLPEWITTLGPRDDGETRHVYLGGSHLSSHIIDRLREANAPGMQFHYSLQAATLTQHFGSIAEGLHFWQELADVEADCTIEVDQTYERDVIVFLGRLAETPEFKNAQTKPILAKRIIHIFNLMANDAEIKGRGLVIISNGLTSCDDRIISALDQLDIMKQIYNAEQLGISDGAEDTLKRLGKGLFYLEKVQNAATAHASTLTFVDEIEVQLAFQLGLRKRFDLPLSTSNMIFRGCAQVSDAQLAAAGDRIEEASNEAALQAFLEEWEPWIRYQRKKLVIPYEDLTATSYEGALTCSLIYDETTQPVIYMDKVYDYAAFVKNYVEKGIDPFNREPIDFSKLRRIEQ